MWAPDWVEDRELIAVLSKVGGIDFGVGTGPERGRRPCSIALTLGEVRVHRTPWASISGKMEQPEGRFKSY